MIRKSILINTLSYLRSGVRSILNPFLAIILILFFTSSSCLSFNSHCAQNLQVKKSFKVTSDNLINHIVKSEFQVNNIPFSMEIEDSEEECVDEEIDDEYSLKITHQIRKALVDVELDKKNSIKSAAFSFHSSIPLFILYHSWKDDLC